MRADLSEAVRWWAKSAANGNKKVRQALDYVAEIARNGSGAGMAALRANGLTW